jgi:hypothetical protein
MNKEGGAPLYNDSKNIISKCGSCNLFRKWTSFTNKQSRLTNTKTKSEKKYKIKKENVS